jgi:hypothetical protein
MERHLIIPFEEPEDPEAAVTAGTLFKVADKLVRGINMGNEATVKTKRGVENITANLEPRITQLETDQRAAKLVADALVERNKIVDGYLNTISVAMVWIKEKCGWWLVKILQMLALSLGAFIVNLILSVIAKATGWHDIPHIPVFSPQ